MGYKLSNLAAEDFANIYEYTLLNFGVLQADAYTESLENTFHLLAGSPLMAKECSEIVAGVRRHDHQQHSIFYRCRERDILVIRILHQQMVPLRDLFDI
ncbi:MAG TPA: type II toxin-antitoxin system RelE/ParE family toxin [Candidatus Halomonas stercoripullorum]|uniref:Toxin n=1 Tax=Candidatus Halomonas stercoripullorum TaxID=2838617 RepID=A0A9D2B5U1_9GAMM|nr:type II toxin-antitoxin system RelE/ParE family toxin [Candidatus Halomonas stercoripullorum]